MPGVSEKRLFAVRGATPVDANDAISIESCTKELLSELIERNGIKGGDMVSCLFTTTPDLNAQFPAVAARKLGLNHVPLMCAREIDVPGAMPRVVRVLLHYYGDPAREPVHCYLGAAQSLRSDLHAAQ